MLAHGPINDSTHINDDLWCGKVALLVDNICCFRARRHMVFKPLLSILVRLVSAIAFPIFASIDVISHQAGVIKERVWVWLSKDGAAKQEHLAKIEKYKDVVRRCLMGIAGSQIGWIYPDGPTQHFIPSFIQPGMRTNSGKFYFANGVQVKTPALNKSSDDPQVKFKEIIDMVKQAKKEGKKIAVVGAGMSQGQQNLPLDGQILIDLHLKTKPFQMSPFAVVS